MAAPGPKPQEQTSQPQANAAPQVKQLEPTPLLAQQLAAKFLAGNYQAMATLISPALLVTPAHVLEQSQILNEDTQEATIQFLGIPEQPRLAKVVDIDEAGDFAVLELDAPVAIELPTTLIRPTEFLGSMTWESYWTMMSPPAELPVTGTMLEEHQIAGRTYRQLQTSSPFTNVGGISGAPVVVGTSLVGIIAGSGDNNQGMIWEAIPINEMINSGETDAVASLLPSDTRRSRRGPSPWITQQDFQRFSEEAIAVLSDACALGPFFGKKILHIPDLLLAFLRQPNGQFQQVLSSRGVNLPDLLGVKPETISLAWGNYPKLTSVPPISVNVRRALAVALQKAGRDGPVEDRHLLAGVLSASRNETVKALNTLGITVAAIPLPETEAPEREAVLAGYQSDDATGKDLLDITPEVEALASVLAAKDVDPPLSLGLFGDWGTGKSFFMRKLEAEIKRLGEDAKEAREQGAETAYCSNIVQIPFNAWNYIDSDLWSSLTSEIFENLAAAIVKERGLEGPGRSQDPEELAAQRELALAATSSSEAILAEAERKKAVAEEELKRTEERLANLQKSEAAIESALTPGEILKQALGFAMQDKEMKKYVGQISQALRIPETKAAATEVQSEILQLRNVWDTIVFTLKTERRLWMWLAALGLALVFGWGVTHYLTQLGLVANRILAGLLGLSALLAPFVRTASKAAAVVNAAKESKKKLIEDKKKAQMEQLKATRETVRQNVEAARRNVADAHEKVKALNEQLENMRADRRLADYIRERNQSTDYTQHLGIISRVRTDLRHLSTLLRDVKEEEAQDEFERGMKIRQREKDGDRKLFPRIDRIILYIDDLDRCPEKNVVEVLQAVHLLLAFPLFVVVVGVDPRWLLYSLQQSSAAFQSKQLEKDGELIHDGHWQSTPLNYLEKIFQIPYSLRPISQKGFGQLVDEFAKAKSVWAPHAASGSSGGGTGSPRSEPAPVSPATPSSVASVAPAGGPTSGVTVASPTQTVDVAGGATTPVGGPAAPTAESASVREPSYVSGTAQAAVNRAPEHLQIDDAERAFMKRLHEFIPTPRSGKRFINIYRLLRASVTESERPGFAGDAQGGTYQAAMLLLAILTGYPQEATEILRRLIEEKPQGNWWAFIDAVKIEMCRKRVSPSVPGAKKTADKNGPPAEAVQGEPVGASENGDWVELMARLERFKKGFSDRPVHQFGVWAPRVARYSFQSGRVLYYQQR